jgi:CDP-Glycerol:Poly(glycerophosphate) glycerophosphotransferase
LWSAAGYTGGPDVGTLLCVGLYPYDVVQLLVVAREARDRLGLEPVFLDVDIAPPGVSAETRELVSASGFDTVTARLIAEDDGQPRNRIDSLRWQRQATDQLIEKLLEEIAPTAILAGINPPPGFFLDRAAARGIPTVLLQLFHWGDREFYRGLHGDDRRQEEAGLSTLQRLKRVVRRRADAYAGLAPHIAWDVSEATVAVQGPATGRRLVADGIPADHVVVTGNPALDDLYALKSRTAEADRRLRRQLGLASDATIISHMRSHEGRLVGIPVSTLHASQTDIIRALQAADPGAVIIVKLHPKEDSDESAFVRSIDPSVLVVGEDVNTDDLLSASDVVVGTLSTTLLYGVLLDRPTVSAWLWPGLDYFRTSTEWSGVERVFTPAALTSSVRAHLHDPAHHEAWRKRREAFVDAEFVYDGNSTERLVGLLDREITAATPVTAATPR